MLGILGESFMVAARTDGFRHEPRPIGVIETPATHDPERAWIAADREGRRLQGTSPVRRKGIPGIAPRSLWRALHIGHGRRQHG